MNKKYSKRAQARRYALQALYGWMLTNNPIADIEKLVLSEHNHTKFDVEYFQEILNGVATNSQELDELFSPFLDRAVHELLPIEWTILRMGSYELKNRLEIPYKVILDQSLELAKTFGATDGHKYVNGVLDKLAKALREIEIP